MRLRSVVTTVLSTTSPVMGREVIFAVLCWLALKNTSAKVISIAAPIRVLDSINAASVSRLYRNVPLGIYASAVPHAAYSFNVPTFLPANTNFNVAPKDDAVTAQNTFTFLRDSYGRQYQDSPQMSAYKTMFPQQFVPIQNLPAHLSQPLVAASPSFQFKQATPQFFGQAQQLSTPQLQSLSPALLNRFTALHSQAQSNEHVKPTAQPQQSKNKEVYVESYAHPAFQYGSLKSEQKPQYVNVQQYASLKNQPQPQYVNFGQYGSLKSDAKPQYITVEKYGSLKSDPKPQYVTVENYSEIKSEPKPQYVKEQTIKVYENNEQNAKQSQQSVQTAKLIHAKVPDPSVTTHADGKTTVVIPTKPPLPLLDLTLLEPLTFDNPLVPQVQHFLPRINQATYHKLPDLNVVKKHKTEFAVQNNKSYGSTQKVKPKKIAPKKKHKKQRPQNEHNDDEEVIHTPTTTSDLDESPEFSYEINSPNYKETYTEKKVSYNKETKPEPVHFNYKKETQSEPVNYSYEKHVQNEPVHYSYVSSSKAPAQVKQITYKNIEQPKQLIYHFKPAENTQDQNEERILSSPPTSSEESLDISPESDKGTEKEHNDHTNERPVKPQNHHYTNPEHREEIISQNHHGKEQSNAYVRPSPVPQQQQHFQPITPEYEEVIELLPTHTPHKSSNIDENIDELATPHRSHQHSKHNSQLSANRHESPRENHNIQYSSVPTVHEKSKRIIIKEEAPSNTQSDSEELMADMIKQQQQNEDDFENAYKNAAYGFPAFDTPTIDVEKEIYNPEAYGASRYHEEDNIDHSPLQQYQEDGDEFPKYTRANYKDTRDKTQEDYFLDVAVSRPESLRDRHHQKENYYKMFAENKPEKYFGKSENKKQNAKYIIGPTTIYSGFQSKPQYAQQKSSPHLYEFNFVQKTPKDSSAFASRPDHRYKSKTQFVEPQFQYGFEPISLPQLLDSELAAMASNDNIESETPGTRKKVYKENWYIKKTTTGKAAR